VLLDLAGVISSTDPFSMQALGVPMVLLFLLSGRPTMRRHR